MLHTIKIKSKDMDLTYTRILKFNLHREWDEIMPWYYVMILG